MVEKPKKDDEVELRPDGWDRFEKAVDAAVKGGPKHRVVKKDEPKPHKVKKDKKSDD